MSKNQPCRAFDLRLAEMRETAIKTSTPWFLWVNILFSLFILGRSWFAPQSLIVAPHTLAALLETMALLVLFISASVIFIMRMAPFQDALWLRKLAKATILTLSLCWSVGFYVLIINEDMRIIFPFTALLLFTALISLYFDPRILLGFIAPIWLTVLVMSLFYTANLTVINAFMWVLLAGLIESGRQMLNRWFLLALRHQQENADLIDQLELLANRDPLTGIANRRAFESRMDQEIARHKREGGTFTLIMLDVDHFKLYNDYYGHQRGDRCLVTIAQCLARAALPVTGIPGRFGGEEFVLLLPRSTPSEALDVARDIAQEMRLQNIEHLTSPVLPRVTVSLGVASWSEGMKARTLIHNADKALYQAKQQGRNRWVLFE
ncbi:GGDEF domain-containing protein [[Enterobacter] lignolyticus]|uniref:diguanylate cyclase n=2 Tax=[Enterobacter] lignolyticus TaxID=1334193 RepID=E3G8X3_ENTLS|nr:membrane-associated sensor domain-containing protein [[Enterobacter] lignolyticus]ADO48694.1 diguanylate cyclase [[Enterobacter] lignolyticus SCF1]ALR76623.1 diguanylate cyclase [[Enterobacter] lignolyticus]